MDSTFHPPFASALALFCLTAFWLSVPAFAQNVGDSCTGTDRAYTVSGSSNSLLICNGTTLELLEKDLSNPVRKGIGTASPAATLHVNGEAIIGNTGLACSGTTAGGMRWNSESSCIQFCNGTSWTCINQTNCSLSPVGTVCPDGTVYAGTSPASGTPMYVTRCDGGRVWGGSSCSGTRLTRAWNNGNMSNNVNTVLVECSDVPSCTTAGPDGEANTATLAPLDSDTGTGGVQPHQAAVYCDGLNIHGQTDWYLPSLPELNVIMRANNPDLTNGTGDDNTLGDFAMTTYYWSSNENGASFAVVQRSSDVGINSTNKQGGYGVRCARR